MSRARHRQPLRQPRGPRATLPPAPPRPERPQEHHYRIGAACLDCANWEDQCTCNDDEEQP